MAAHPAFRVHRLAASAAGGLLAVWGLSSAVPVSPALPAGMASGGVWVDQQEVRRAGGQAAVDACAGPVRFTPVTVSVSITEHDLCGGWDRMGWIQPDTVVSVQGYGPFTAVQRMVVPQGAKEGVLGGFAGGYPPIFLQTCIPGTSEMLLIALR